MTALERAEGAATKRPEWLRKIRRRRPPLLYMGLVRESAGTAGSRPDASGTGAA
jgi:hypothetical protein